MAWRVAQSLEQLLAEINQRSPNRSKISDGSIGNAAHQSRESDHNPWVRDGAVGVVTARDFTNDPDHGFDSSDFADWLRVRCRDGAEHRVKYVISDRRIASATPKPGYAAWAWRPYDGPNAHLHHVHVSVRSEKSRYDDAGPWGWAREEDDDMKLTDDVKLGPKGQRRMGGAKSADVALLLQGYNPGTRAARDEIAAGFKAVQAQLGAQQAIIGKLLGALKDGGSLTEQQAVEAAEAGARAALGVLGRDLVDTEDDGDDVPSPNAGA